MYLLQPLSTVVRINAGRHPDIPHPGAQVRCDSPWLRHSPARRTSSSPRTPTHTFRKNPSPAPFLRRCGLLMTILAPQGVQRGSRPSHPRASDMFSQIFLAILTRTSTTRGAPRLPHGIPISSPTQIWRRARIPGLCSALRTRAAASRLFWALDLF